MKKSSLTFAPEAGSQRMRDVINKGLTEDDIFSVPESWVTDTGQNAFSESYFNADTVRSLLELAKFL